MARPWLLLTTLMAGLLLGPVAALADEHEDPEYARSGLYLRGSFGLGVWTSKTGFVDAAPVEWRPEAALDFALGWRNSERLALELEAEWITNRDGIGFGYWSIGANGKFYFLEEQIQPYLIVGANGTWAKIQGTPSFRDDWSFRQGLGVDYYLTEHWAVSTESTFVWGVGDLWKNYYVTLTAGAMYRF